MFFTAAPAPYVLDGDSLKSDSVDLTRPGFLHVTVAGTIKYTTTGGSTITKTVPANWIEWSMVKRLWSTGTTATEIWVHAHAT